MSKLSKDSLMSIYPGVLNRDKLFNSLGQSVAESLGEAFLNVKHANIYLRISELDEDVLDILAQDFNISWYDYDFQLETKRRVVAAAFSVHRHLGTAGAMTTAISAIWPNSSVEEWFDYGGDPYFFRVLVEANDGEPGVEPIRFSAIDKMVQLYKNERSWLDGGSVILRITCNVIVQTKQGQRKFHSVLCGTVPRVSTHGKVFQSVLNVESAGDPVKFHTGHTGEYVAGTVPHNFTHGDISDGGLQVGASLGVSTYNSTPCGTPLGALM